MTLVRLSYFILLLRYFLFILFLCIPGRALSAESVSLQLRWEPSFQFAGYYAALWQGYYADAGLNVEIRSAFIADDEFIDPIQQLVSGNADFAVGLLDALVASDHGEDIKIVSPIFQHSPVAIYSLSDTPLDSVRDLAKLRVAVNAEDMALVYRALMSVQGFRVNEDKILWLAETDRISHLAPLREGIADAIVSYGVAAELEAEKQGLHLNKLNPADFGLDLYGDTLLTHQRTLSKSPELVHRFRIATLKGWHYALEHRQEIAEKIKAELPRRYYRFPGAESYNRVFADAIDQYLLYPSVPLGQNNPARWQQIVKDLKASQALNGEVEVNRLFAPMGNHDNKHWYYIIPIMLTTLLVIAPLLFSRKKVKRAWPYFAVVLFTVLTNYLIQVYAGHTYQQKKQIEAGQYLNSLTTKLVEVLRRHLALTDSLALYIRLNPDISMQEFELYASSLFRLDTLLNNIAAAPDMRIDMIYPLDGNEAALGVNYRSNLKQWQGVEFAIHRAKATLDGPVNLLQGGQALLLHSPVFDGITGEVWGIVSAPLRTEVLFRELNLEGSASDWDVTVAIANNVGANRNTIFDGDAQLEQQFLAERSVNVGGQNWHLGIRANAGQLAPQQLQKPLHAGSLIISALVVFLIWLSQQQGRKERRYQTEIHQNEQLLREVGKLAKIDGWKMDSNYQFVQLSRHLAKMLGVGTNTSHKPYLKELLSLLDRTQANRVNRYFIAGLQGKPFDIEFSLKAANDELHWMRVIGNPLLEKGRRSVVGAIIDISEKKKHLDQINHQARHDTLTGLPNRLHFNNTLNKAIASHNGKDRPASSLAVLFIDLDNFKPVNDSLGHQAGDELLRQVAQRILRCVSETDVVARYSGDEFTVILNINPETVTASHVAQRILTAFNNSFALEQGQVYVGASIGIAAYPQDGNTAETLVSNADQAMYQVKKSGRNSWQSYSAELNSLTERKHYLHTRLAAALERGNLEVHYQPIVRLSDGAVLKCEALVRWFDEGDMIPTDEFITLAEEVGLINKVDHLVLDKASHDLACVSDPKGCPIGLSVNISPLIFSAQDNSLCLWEEKVVAATQSLQITVEITERLLAEDSERALNVLTRLRALGVRIAIDDFGTGYSSLSYLTKFPIDIIKIDRSFVSQLGSNATTTTLVNAILNLANELSLTVVAEGIETEAQLNYLRNRGCHFGQGYLLDKPMPVEDLLSTLEYQANNHQPLTVNS